MQSSDKAVHQSINAISTFPNRKIVKTSCFLKLGRSCTVHVSALLYLLCLYSPLYTAETLSSTLSTPAIIPDHPLALSELVEIALKNNPSTKQVYWNAERATANVGIAESLFYPHFDAEGVGLLEKNFDPKSRSAKYSVGISLNMLLYDCGKSRAHVDATKKLLEAASWNVDWNVQQVLVQVFDCAYRRLYAQEVYEATVLSVCEAEKMYEAAKELNRVGLKPICDIYATKATLASLKMDLCSQQQLVKESEAKLAITLGLQATTPLALQSVEISEGPKKETIDQLISYANAHRADLQEKQARYAAALFEVQKEKATAWPELSIFGRDGVETTYHTSQCEDRSRSLHHNETSRQQNIGLKVEVPLFTGFELLYKKRAALAEAKLSNAQITALQLDISREVAVAIYSLESAQEKLPLAGENVENATYAYESIFERYIAGKSEIAELYNAQQQVASARIQYSTVKTQWLTAIATLAYATGTLQ